MPETKLVLAGPLASLEALRSRIEPTTPATPRITVYLPLQRTVPEVRQNALLLERAAREAEPLLCKIGTPADRAAILARSLRCRGEVWRGRGRHAAATGRVQADGSDDLLDVLTEVVLRHGGDVQSIEAERLPSPTGVAAELR
ncbi:hypothetical protein KJ059_02190 [Myxococcota bacterium]|nr:hypothetical protein [Myxococcota bacterium]MCZ7619373.1 hypothetical protein [Myxococcota bacterium]